MAYAALLSLTQTLEQILAFGDEIRIFYDEKQIKSLHEKLSFLLSFLDDSSPRNTESMTCLEARIRDATYKAEDIIELHMLIEILSEMQHMKRGVIGCFGKIVVMPVFHNSEIYEGLRKVIKKIDSILVDVEKMMGMKNIEGSSNIDSSNKSTVVGFDNDSMQIKDPLSGPPPKFKSTSVVGIEDTGKTKLTKLQ